jgi:hypothetical protein
MRLSVYAFAAAAALIHAGPSICCVEGGAPEGAGGAAPPVEPAAPLAPPAAQTARKPAPARRQKPKDLPVEAGRVHLVMQTSMVADKDGVGVARDRVATASEGLADQLVRQEKARRARDEDLEFTTTPVVALD